MLKFVEEFQRYVAITGFRDIRIRNVDQFLKGTTSDRPRNATVQFFDANLVATWQHLYFAAVNALTVFRNKENISKSLAMETMLYASAQHQIRKATEIIGISQRTKEVAVLIIGEEPETVETALTTLAKRMDGKEDEAVLELTKEKIARVKKTFGISDVELKSVSKRSDSESALIDLVIERMALLSTVR